MGPMGHDKKSVEYSEGRGNNLGKAKNRTRTWKQFKDLFRTPTRTGERQTAYDKMSEDDQKRLKGVSIGQVWKPEATPGAGA